MKIEVAVRGQELCENRGGRQEVRSCVKIEGGRQRSGAV